MQNKLYAILYFLAIFFIGCEEVTKWDLEAGSNGQLVVEAILTDETRIQEVKLSQSVNNLNDPTSNVINAQVWVEANNQIYNFIADASKPGLYISEDTFGVLNNLVYTLNIEWEGESYQASSELSDVAPIPEFTFPESINEDTLRLPNFDLYLFNVNQQAMYDMQIDWSHLSGDSLDQARVVFYTFNTLEVSAYSPNRDEDVTFPRGSIITIRKHGLNEDFATYLRSLAIETSWRGSFFYGASSSLPTNISNGGLGFFSTCAVLTERFVVE